MSLSVTDPIGRAYESTRQALFEPFDLRKWLTLGFCAWLAQLGEASGGTGGPGGGGNGGSGGGGRSFGGVQDWIGSHLLLVVALVAIVVLISATFLMLLLWLSSRGKFMFLDGLIENRGAVVEPWHRFRDLAYSLFLFRAALMLVGLVIFGGLAAAAGFVLFPAFRSGNFEPLTLLVVASIGTVAMILAVPFALIHVFTNEFVVPVMYLRNCGVRQGWDEVRGFLGAEALSVFLYLLLKFAMGIASIVILIIATCLTLCAVAIPYVGTVILLPIPVFFRYYTLEFLAQRGGDYERLRIRS
jgi:hypothetical protein